MGIIRLPQFPRVTAKQPRSKAAKEILYKAAVDTADGDPKEMTVAVSNFEHCEDVERCKRTEGCLPSEGSSPSEPYEVLYEVDGF